jgi:NADPH2:quinone reductase
MKAIVFDKIGDPQDVLQLRDIPIPQPGDNEVLLRMVSASVNPGDFLFIQNLYPEPKKPKFPAQIAGNHGAGIVEAAGRDVKIPPGTLVAFSYYKTWAEYAVVPQEWLIPLPADYPMGKAGQLVNPVSGWDLLKMAKVAAGQWLVVTAGNSATAVIVAQFAQLQGIKVISVVRRESPAIPLQKMGTTTIIDLSKLQGPIRDEVMKITGGIGIHGFVDNVGGPVTGELIRSMAPGGNIVINGAMSAEVFHLHNFDILLKGLQVQAHFYRFFFTPPRPEDKDELQEIIRITGATDFVLPVGGTHSLDDFKTAVAETIHQPEKGKHFFVPR